MEILVTGSRGFVGRNLIAHLKQRGYSDILEYDIDTDPRLLDGYTRRCGFVFHLAGIQRPQNPDEFMAGNMGFTQTLIESLQKHGSKAPVLVSSSIQAELDNPYGQSKKAGEDCILAHAEKSGAAVYVYRLPNVFGKWGRPNYNSAVATFCHNIARDLPITVNDPEAVISLVYIDDVCVQFIRALEQNANRIGQYCMVEPVYTVKLGRIAQLLESFRESRGNLLIPDFADEFTKKLYSTYLSYLPEDAFSYPLKMHSDHSGSFTEFLRSNSNGQVSVNISKPGITKGNHWHHSKNEKFLVVSGQGVIRLRAPGLEKTIEYHVSGGNLQAVDIPPGYTHSIENTGDCDMVTVMWANECFDPANPDTNALEV
ncbi:MAG: capsular polysaccharide biosynthesis protein CapF [Oscillospiraceae bacterium]|nr:capsular polysaccharide biosynthesis protein CapF [Oscillospiraceae bacterium]